MMYLWQMAPVYFFLAFFALLMAVLYHRYRFGGNVHGSFFLALLVCLAVALGQLLFRDSVAIQRLLLPWIRSAVHNYLALLGIILTLLVVVCSRSKRWARGLLMSSWVVAVIGDGRIFAGRIDQGFMILAAAVAVAFIGALLIRGENSWRPQPFIVWTPRREMAVFTAIMIITLFIKLYKFQDCMAGLAVDEAVKGRVAIEILEGKVDFLPYFYFRESPYFYLVALMMKFLGPTVNAMRMTSTVIASLALVVMYFLLRRMLGVETAFVSSLFLTISLWHNEESRVCQRLVLVLLMQALLLFIVFRIYESARWYHYPLLGITMAASYYTYPPIRVMPIVLAMAALYLLATRPTWSLKQSPLLLLTAVFFLITIMAPLGHDALKWPQYFLTDEQLGYHVDPWAKDWGEALKNITALYETWHLRTAAFGTVRPVNVNIPLLEPFVSILFVIGLGISLAKSNRFPHYLLCVNFLAGLAPGILSWPFERRLIIATLLTFTFAAIAFLMLWEQVRHALARFPEMSKVAWFLIPMSLCFPLYSGWRILGERLYSYNQFKYASAPLEYAGTLRDNYEVVIFTEYFDPNTYIIACHDKIYGPDHPHMDHIQPSPKEAFIPYRGYLDRNLAYILAEPGGQRTIDEKILQTYPHAVRNEFKDENGHLMFVVYLVGKQEINALAIKQGLDDEQ